MSAILDTVDLGSPASDLFPGARGQLLATLAQLATPVTTRGLAGHAGVSPQTALDTVNDLAESGLVSLERAGRALMVAFNRDHLLAQPLIAALETRGRLVAHLTHELRGWRQLAGAWLLGSGARGDGDRHSDIDLLLVAKTSTDATAWLDASARLVDRVQAWTGNEAQLVAHTRASLSKLVKSDNPLIVAVRAEGIPLTPASRALLRAAS